MWKEYRKLAIQEMRPYMPGENLEGVSVSPADTPEYGEMIARNSDNHADQWYVAKNFFLKNIEWLEQQDQNAEVIYGFGSPHSDRGYYEKLAFKPVPITTFGQMLTHAKSALGQTFCGYKGGEFLMHEFSECRIGEYGISGEDITSMHLKYWALNSQRKHS